MRTGQEGQFLESLRSNDDLRQLVKRMDFWDLKPGWKELRRVHCALLVLCDLEFVTLDRPHPVDGAETAWSMLVSRSHQLRSLKVTFGTMPFTQVAGDLVRFANLELLDLEADTPSFIDQDVTLPKEQPSFKLAELRLKQCDSFQRVISWMLTKTSREASLRKLDLHIDKGRCPDWLWAFHSLPVLRDLSQFSLTLSLNVIPTRDNPPLSLRFLDDEDLLHLPELLSMLPPHLSHLTLAAPGGSAFFVPNILREILEKSGVQAKILELKCTSFPSLWENEARKDFLNLMREAQTEVGERTGGSVKWWVGDEQIDLRFDVSLPI
ncbi:hypothetical protein BT69DRAFT_1353361 [Atractiella rhizophila]|nr:hypothetical protein BT69DRAFT_1353361 [Atractiella rhizophila]